MSVAIKKVVAAVIEKNGAFLIAKRKKNAVLSGKWEFPGGKLEPGESAAAGLKRELLEEFAVSARIGKFICSVRCEHDGVPIELSAFRASFDPGELSLRAHEQVLWVPLNELSDHDLLDADKEIVNHLAGS